MNTYSQIEGPEGQIYGQLNIEVFNENGYSDNVIDINDTFTVKITIQFEGDLKSITSLMLRKLVAKIFIESLGPRNEYVLTAIEKSWDASVKSFEFNATVPAGQLPVGLYKITGIVNAVNEDGIDLITFFEEGSLIQIYS